MARKTKYVTISDEGRDKGKIFIITEMPAHQAEQWAMRALMTIAEAGIDLPDAAIGSGMAGIAAVGLKAIFAVPFDKISGLLEEMIGCVRRVTNPGGVEFIRDIVRDGVGDDVEEVQTYMTLRSEVFELHTGFSVAGAISDHSASAFAILRQGNTSTSPSPSAS